MVLAFVPRDGRAFSVLRAGLAIALGIGVVCVGLGGADPAHAVAGSPTWTPAAPSRTPWEPPPDTALSAVNDDATGQLLVYDPAVTTSCGAITPVWVWDGQTWANSPGGTEPGVRVQPTLVYDAATQRVLMFGGDRPSCGGQPAVVLGDTWEWNGNRWTQQHPTTSPPAGTGACAAYDAATGQVVMYRDVVNVSGAGDPNTWTWDGTSWTAHLLTPSPPLSNCGMAYDPIRRQVVLAAEDASAAMVQTWVWNGVAWTQFAPSGPAEFGLSPTISYDFDLGEVVFYNGRAPCTGFFFGDCSQPASETWAWNGASWGDITSSAAPPSRFDGAQAYDDGTQQLVLFGGFPGAGSSLADTWIYAASGSSSVTPQRLAGNDRDDTAVAVSQAKYSAPQSAEAVVLTRSDGFADALAGGPLAAAKHAPLLLTSSGSLDPSTEAEIVRVLAPGATVYLLGGTSALTSAVQSQVALLGYPVERIAGADRYATAVDVAVAIGNPTTVFEASGLDFPDALSAIPAAAAEHAAILLTDGAAQAPATAAYLAARARVRYAVGGPAATADPTATALVGSDRYATSAAVARAFFPSATSFGAATGVGFADALAGGVLSASRGQPILLVPGSGQVPEPIHAFIATHAGAMTTAEVFGGPDAVGDQIVAALTATVGGH